MFLSEGSLRYIKITTRGDCRSEYACIWAPYPATYTFSLVTRIRLYPKSACLFMILVLQMRHYYYYLCRLIAF